MALIIDRIRKNVADDVVLDPGPADARLWVNRSGELMLNVSGTPEEVGAGGGVGSSDEVDLRTSAPAGVADTAWVEYSGTTPTMTIAWKARISGSVYTIASVTV